jgi:hypothetical protein
MGKDEELAVSGGVDWVEDITKEAVLYNFKKIS